MIDAAERDGRLRPGGTIVEATAGNTGLGLALVGRAKGYRVVLVVPDKMSTEKVLHLKAMGAEVHITRSDVGKGHPEYYQDVAARLAKDIPGAFFADQFNNPANPLAHECSTAPEIWAQTQHDLDAIVVGVGSAGTLTGLTRFFKRVQPELEMVLADPVGSVMAEYSRSGTLATPGSWAVEGIGEDFIPSIADLSSVRHAYSISDEESFDHARQLLQGRRHSRRFVHRHPARRGAALLPRTDRAEARGQLRLRHRHALPVEGLQRPVDERPGPAATQALRRPARPDRAALRRRPRDQRRPRRHPAHRVPAHAPGGCVATAGAGERQATGRRDRRIRHPAGRARRRRALSQ